MFLELLSHLGHILEQLRITFVVIRLRNELLRAGKVMTKQEIL